MAKSRKSGSMHAATTASGDASNVAFHVEPPPTGEARRSLPADATAADHLLSETAVISVHATAREARAAAHKARRDWELYAVGDRGELAGVLSMATLLDLCDDDRIASYLESPRATVQPHDDQEHVALTAIRNDLLDVPVTDAKGRFLGTVPALALLRVLHQEHVEDIDRLSGVLRRTEQAARALDDPPTRRMRERLPWLVVGLAGSAIATWIMSVFEPVLERRLAVAFFVPAIVYLADAIGTQTEAIAVRGLSFRQFESRGRLLLQELGTGFLLGLALGAPVLPAVWWIFGDIRLGVAVALAIVVAGTIATAVGLGFPMLLLRLGKDPALGSGPLATVVQDVTSLVTYFLAVQLLLSG
jgi:magnesium transporter